MKTKWLKAAFVISLALNCMAAGGLTYKYIFAPSYDRSKAADGRTGRVHLLGNDARLELQGRLSAERDKIRSAQDRLLELLMQDRPDREKINAQIDAISKTQADVQHAVMDQLLKEIEPMTPEQKRAFLARLRKGMRCKGLFGMGRGMEHESGWRKKRRHSP